MPSCGKPRIEFTLNFAFALMFGPSFGRGSLSRTKGLLVTPSIVEYTCQSELKEVPNSFRIAWFLIEDRLLGHSVKRIII